MKENEFYPLGFKHRNISLLLLGFLITLYLGRIPNTWSWMFYQNCQNIEFLLDYFSAHEKAIASVLIWGDRVYPSVCFEYKTASEVLSKQFHQFLKKKSNLPFSENTQNFSAYISPIKYFSGAVLY